MLLDLSRVTDALVSLIDKYIRASPDMESLALPFEVSPEPRDKLKGDGTIGIYLYHLTEDAYYKNLPSTSADLPPLRFTPMGLNLYYQLSAFSALEGRTGIYREQVLMGLAVKALRDYPVIDHMTDIGDVFVFPPGLDPPGNRVRISLLPVLHNEALNYSTSSDKPLRLCAYYQVSVALLEPEKPTLRAGRVLKYGIFTFTRGAPRLDGSRSTVAFTDPENVLRKVEIQPAEAAIRNLPNNTGEIIFFGSDLAGDETTLLIKSTLLDEPVEVGPDWGVTATDNEIFAAVHPLAGSTKIVPGMYSAVARVTTRQMGPDSQLRTFIKTSNETPFIVTPRIDSISTPVGNVVTVKGAEFPDPLVFPEAVEVFVGSHKLPRTVTLQAGEFKVVDSATLQFQYPIPEIKSAETLPFRLIINGAESAPNWVVVP